MKSDKEFQESETLRKIEFTVPSQDLLQKTLAESSKLLAESKTKRKRIMYIRFLTAAVALIIISLAVYAKNNDNPEMVKKVTERNKDKGKLKLYFFPDKSIMSIMADFDYGDIDYLVASDLIVWGKVTKTGKEIEFSVIEILKGKKEDFKVRDLPGDSRREIACMADLKWNKGETVCLFMGKDEKGKLFLRGHGNGKVKLPYRGIQNLEQLRKKITGG